MFKKIYVYYITYNFRNGNGSMEITRTKPIKTMDDIIMVNKFLEEEYKYKSAYITNFIKIKPRKDAYKHLSENGKSL